MWGVERLKAVCQSASAWFVFSLECISNAFDCFHDGAGVTMAFESQHFLFVLLLSVRNNKELFC